MAVGRRGPLHHGQSAARRARVWDLVQSARHGLEDATAEQIVAWAAHTFGDRWAVASSMANGMRPRALDRNGVIRNAA